MSGLELAMGGAVLLGVIWLVLGGVRKYCFKRAVDAFSEKVKGLRAEGINAEISLVYGFGAVDVSPKKGHVYVLLKGPESEQVPPRFSLQGSPPPSLSDTTLAWMRSLDDAFWSTLCQVGWWCPRPHLCFESDERVKRTKGGFFFYFR